MKILLVGGGTGGHVFPAVAIAEAFQRCDPQVSLAFAGRSDGMEARIVQARGWPFHALVAAPLKGMGFVRRLVGLVTACKALIGSMRLIKREKPDCVVGTGGYVSGPLLLAASFMRRPTVVHEQNSIPGLTNRLLKRFVGRICTTFAESVRYFPKDKVVETGLPVRSDLVAIHRDEAVPSNPPLVLLVMGGSQGSTPLNTIMVQSVARLRKHAPTCRVIHQVGPLADCAAIQRAYRKANIEADVVPFIDHMEAIYPTVHLAISRAGAGSIAELALAGVPAILVPFPHAADNHQEKNAREVVACGGAELIREADLSPERFVETCVRLLKDTERLSMMRDAMRRLARPDAADRVVKVCYEVMHV